MPSHGVARTAAWQLLEEDSPEADGHIKVRRPLSLVAFFTSYIFTGDHSKEDKILLVKIGEYIGFRVYHGSYSLWSPILLIVEI